MAHENEHLDDEVIDLGSVTGETHGINGLVQPDAGMGRQQLGILAD